jgi:hypothetical protein
LNKETAKIAGRKASSDSLTNKIATLSARAWTPQQAKAASFRPSLIIAITTATTSFQLQRSLPPITLHLNLLAIL